MAKKNLEKKRQDAKSAVESYYAKDMKLLLDESIFCITALPYYFYENIYFGNVILYPKRIKDKFDEISKMGYIQKRNIDMLKRNIKDQKFYDYIAVDAGKDFLETIEFLKDKDDIVLLLSDEEKAEEARKQGIKVKNLKKGFEELVCYDMDFETIGAIQWKNQKPYIKCKDGKSKVFVFDENFKEKEIPNEGVKIEVNDYIMFVKKLHDIKTIIVYQLFSLHSRNHAIKIFWTDIPNTRVTNRFVEMQDEILKNLIRKKIREN